MLPVLDLDAFTIIRLATPIICLSSAVYLFSIRGKSAPSEDHIPILSAREDTPAVRFVERGRGGLEIFTGIDGFCVPLKITLRSSVFVYLR